MSGHIPGNVGAEADPPSVVTDLGLTIVWVINSPAKPVVAELTLIQFRWLKSLGPRGPVDERVHVQRGVSLDELQRRGIDASWGNLHTRRVPGGIFRDKFPV